MVMSEKEFICHFADIVARGGNLLLLVNLDPHGAMVEHQRKRLLQIGRWLEKNGEAIYGTRIVAPYSTPDVDYTRSKDGKAIYAIVKEPRPEVVLECDLPEDCVVKALGDQLPLACRHVGNCISVALPGELSGAELPIALVCRRRDGSPFSKFD